MPTARNEDNFFRNRFTSTTAYLIGLVLFLLPFVEIRCNDVPLAENSGLGLAIGSEFRASDKFKSLESMGNNNGSSALEKDKDGKMYVAALAALSLGIIGLILSLVKKKSGMSDVLIAGLAALALLILMVQLKMDIRSKGNENQMESAQSLRLTANFTLWYYLSLISFIAAAFFTYRRNQLEAADRAIPQLHIENPGDQSEFPKSASESDLG